jgi:hypothetical protein
VTGRQIRHRQVLAAAAHGFPEAATVDVADRVPFAVDEQRGLVQAAAIWRCVGVGNVSGAVQVPGVGRTETGGTEGFDQDVKVSG